MTHVGTLWGHALQRQSKVILSVAALNELELDRPLWEFTNKPAEYTSKFSYGKIPTFEGVDGFKLIEGSTIARHLSSIGTKVNLLGSNPQEVAIVDQWIQFSEHEIGTPVGQYSGTVYEYLYPFNPMILEKNKERLVRALNYVESHLATRSSGYVALDRLTLADFVLAGVVLLSAGVSLGSADRAQYPRVFAHYARVTADERVKAYWGTEDFVDVPINEPRTYPST